MSAEAFAAAAAAARGSGNYDVDADDSDSDDVPDLEDASGDIFNEAGKKSDETAKGGTGGGRRPPSSASVAARPPSPPDVTAASPVDVLRVRYVDRPGGAGRQPVLLRPPGEAENYALAPLVACANALFARRELDLPNFGRTSVPVEDLKEAMLSKAFETNAEEAMKLFEELPKLACPPPDGKVGWHVNPGFTASPDDLFYDGALFKAFNLIAVHGFRLDSHATDLDHVVQGGRYDDLVEQLGKMEAEILTVYDPQVDRMEENYGMALSTGQGVEDTKMALNAARKRRDEEARDVTVLSDFLRTAKRRITRDGMSELTNATPPGDVHVLYRDDDFYVLTKGPDGALYTLVDDGAGRGDESSVWERVKLDPDGRGAGRSFVDANFAASSRNLDMPPPLPAELQRLAAERSASAAAAARGANPAEEDDDEEGERDGNRPGESDLEMAMRMQQEEEASAQMEQQMGMDMGMGIGSMGGGPPGQIEEDDLAAALAASMRDAPASAGSPPPQARSNANVDPNKKWNVELAVALEVRSLHHQNIYNTSDDDGLALQPWEDWSHGANLIRSVGEMIAIRSGNALRLMSDGGMKQRVLRTCLGIIRGDEETVPLSLRTDAETIWTEERLMRKEEHNCLARILTGDDDLEEDDDDDEDTTLTEGTVRQWFYERGEGQKPDLSFSPNVQIIKVKKVTAKSKGKRKNRFKLVLSDGQYFVQGMLSPDLNHLIGSSKIKENVVIQVNDYTVTVSQEKTVVTLVDIDVVDASRESKLGHPQDIDEASLWDDDEATLSDDDAVALTPKSAQQWFYHSAGTKTLSPFPFRVQAINVEKFPDLNGTVRFRIGLSDGEEFIQVMLDSKLNHLGDSSQIQENAIIEVKDYKTSVRKGGLPLIVLDIDVVSANFGSRIGDPQDSTSGLTDDFAARLIQAPYRGRLGRKRCVGIMEARAERLAATKITASARGVLARRDLRRRAATVTRLNAAARAFLERGRLRRKASMATVIEAACRGRLARRRHRAAIVAGLDEWRSLREQWEEARFLVRRAKASELELFSWSKLKRDKFDISQANGEDLAEADKEGLDSTSRKFDEAYKQADSSDDESSVEEGDMDVEAEDAVAAANGDGDASSAFAPARTPAHATNDGSSTEQSASIEAFENILLTHSVLKWFKVADGKYKELFRRRMRQLAGGERSRILAKLLQGCNHTIYETYLDQKSGQRIIWTECREKSGEGKDDSQTSILVWYVSKHKWVSRYLEQIDDALARMNRQQFSASAAHLFEDEMETGRMVLDSDMILLDPLANVPLKIHQLPVSDIDKLDRESWTPPLRLTVAEKEVVRKPGNVLVLGRSGTGKTVCICNRMVCDAEFHRGPVSLRQLFVARSPKIKNLVQSLVEEESAIDGLSNVERKFVSFVRLMKDCNAALETLGERTALNVMEASQQPVAFSGFKADFFEGEGCKALRREKKVKLDVLIIWTQIRSYIKGSIEAVTEGRPLSLAEYLGLGKNRCRLDEAKRREAYVVFESYTQWLADNGGYDACDRTADALCRLRRTTMEDRLKVGVNYSRIYVDETQDFTQSDIALFWVLCEGGGSLFLAGDTAQSVEEGINFRFDEVRSVFHELSGGDKSSAPDKPISVTLNFRSHSGVLDVAAAVLHMLYQAFPGAVNKLPDDVGLFKGPRPSVLCRRDNRFLDDSTLKEVLQKNPSLVVLTPDDHVDRLKEDLSCSAETIVLGACEAKGLDFDQVAIVNFFSSSSKQQAKAWKELFRKSSGKQSAWEMSKFPELEMRMKLLYTAITRCRHRLFFAETSSSPCGDAFIRWILGGTSKLAEKQDIADLTVELKSPDEWLSLGIEYALNAEMQDDAEGAKDWFGRASICFQHGGDQDLKSRTTRHADLRQILGAHLLDDERGSDWSERKQSTPKVLASCLANGGFIEDAIQLCEAIQDQCPSGERKFEAIIDEVLVDLKTLGY